MATEKLNRNKIIEKATELFTRQGYHNTSMEDVAKACHIKKASLYHHIPSRKALVIEVIDRVVCIFKANYFNLAYDEQHSIRNRLLMMLDKIEDFYIQTNGHCLVSFLMLETAREMPEVIPIAKDYFSAWVDAIAHLLHEHYGATKSKQLAQDAVSHLHGSIIIGNLFGDGDSKVLKLASERVLNLLPQDLP